MLLYFLRPSSNFSPRSHFELHHCIISAISVITGPETILHKKEIAVRFGLCAGTCTHTTQIHAHIGALLKDQGVTSLAFSLLLLTIVPPHAAGECSVEDKI